MKVPVQVQYHHFYTVLRDDKQTEVLQIKQTHQCVLNVTLFIPIKKSTELHSVVQVIYYCSKKSDNKWI